MKRYIQGHFGICALLAIGGMLASCTGDDLANDGPAKTSFGLSGSPSAPSQNNKIRLGRMPIRVIGCGTL